MSIDFERFGIPIRLVFYDARELQQIVERGARVLGIALAPEGAAEIARRSRGTPRVAARLLRRVRDFAAVDGIERIDAAAADAALQRLEVDAEGLDALDRRYLLCIVQNYGGGPVGVETVAAALGDQRDVIEEVIEPYLVQQGFVQRTARGRALTASAYAHLGLKPLRPPQQLQLLDDEAEESGT